MRYHLFISHAWKYDEDYNKIVSWLDEEEESNSNFSYSNYSVPKENPLHSGKTPKLKEDLTEQIRHASVVIIVGGMYAAHSDWIEYEVNEAVRMNKKILLVRPRGQERIPTFIQDAATLTVGWNSASVVKGVKDI